MHQQEPEVGIRWLPTIGGSFILLFGLYWIVTGALAGARGLVVLVGGIVLLVLGIILLRVGRRDLTRSLRAQPGDRP